MDITVASQIDVTGLPYMRHIERAQALEHTHILSDQWWTMKPPHTAGVLDLWSDDREDGNTNFLTSVSDCLVYMHFEGTKRFLVRAKITGNSQSAVENVLAALKEDYPPIPKRERTVTEVPITFWFHAPPPNNVRSMARDLQVPTWSEIARNYPALRPTLDDMMAWSAPPDGQGKLIIWHSPPGTGKTYAIRALAREWNKWCAFHYITDPDKFLENADYMMAVIMQAQQNSAHTRMVSAMQDEDADNDDVQDAVRGRFFLCLVLEDSGELMNADARERNGQSLSRLLNLTEGFIGQGLNLLVMLTTNEPISTIHPAVARKGRCLQELEFPRFTIPQATAWMGRKLTSADDLKVSDSISLADLYALKDTKE